MDIDIKAILPPSPDQRKGWGRIKRILITFPIEVLEIIGGLSSIVRGILIYAFTFGVLPNIIADFTATNTRLGIIVATSFLIVGFLQLWATAYEKERWSTWAAILTLTVAGLAVSHDIVLYPGYVGIVLQQVCIAIRSGYRETK